nr:aconitase/3-isopropylmalate dehydratase large subunit family protein [uncultured Aminipila sp.]
MNIVEHILLNHSDVGKEIQKDGFILADLDFIYTNGLTLASAIKEINKMENQNLWNKDKVAVFPDHFTPNKDIATANLKKYVRDWVNEKQIKNYFEVGDVGIEHIQFIEKQFVEPGSVVIGGDSHSCSLGALGVFSLGVGTTDLAYGILSGKVWVKVPKVVNIRLDGHFTRPFLSGKDVILNILGSIDINQINYATLVFSGEGCSDLQFNDRVTMCNMAVEGGAKTALFYPDIQMLDKIGYKNYDKNKVRELCDAKDYHQQFSFDLNKLDYQIAIPHSPRNKVDITSLKDRRILLDQVFIGSCTNGSLEDLRISAKLLYGKRRNRNTRLIVIPATPKIYKQAIKEGLIDIFLDAGAVIGPPTCGPCLGGHMGVIGDNEVCLATTNRNFKGRMGSTLGEIYLCSPAVAAASVVKGYIISPEEVDI